MKSTNKQPKGLHKGLIQCQSKIAPKQNEMIEKSTLLRCSGERQKGIMQMHNTYCAVLTTRIRNHLEDYDKCTIEVTERQ